MSAAKLFVKICGITRPQDADLAAELGASAIGFIFWPGSPRYIAPESARAIVRRNSAAVKAVGVFVDEPAERVRQIADAVGLDIVQLHGRESAEYCRQIVTKRGRVPFSAGSIEKGTRPLFAVIKAIGLKNGSPIDVSDIDDDVVILVDAHDPENHGGTGRTIDWDAARVIASSRRTILSGGLNPENIGRAVGAVRPYGVDVSSGVESAPGVKDAMLLKSFFEALND